MQINFFSNVRPREDSVSINDWVYDTLCYLILNGEFTPGLSLSLRSIASPLEVSLTPVREAVSRLISEGALEMSANNRINVSKMTKIKFNEILQVRTDLEPKLAVLSLKNINKSKLKKLIIIDKKLDDSILTGDVKGYIQYNYEFHFNIYNNSKSLVILPIVRSLWLQFSPFYKIIAGRLGTQTIVDYHKHAIEAIQLKDCNALSLAIHNDINEGMGLLQGAICNKS